MKTEYIFYDIETTGLNPRRDRIMQFACIRTDMNLKQIGEPYNMLVKVTEDILPNPEALLTTNITPQMTLADGYSEAEFCKIISDKIFTPNTIVVGYNNIRFDDEFIRHLFWRNFYDPYEWSYKDGRSRWDMLDVVRMTRALRPDGIKWPVDKDNKPTNRLESLAQVNNLNQAKAHDALSDVEALLSLTRLIKDKQPQLFSYLFKMRDKNKVKKLVNLDDKQPFVYVSGRLDSNFNKATVAFPLTAGRNGNIVVYDLRHDPSEFINLPPTEIAKRINASWEEKQVDDFVGVPVKEMHYSRSPAVAPLAVLASQDSWSKIGLNESTIRQNIDLLINNPGFSETVRTIFQDKDEYQMATEVEAKLYDSFIPDADKFRIAKVRQADANVLADFQPNFIDERLDELLLHYKARNYPQSLAEEESVVWEKWRAKTINQQLPEFIESLKHLADNETDESRLFILKELQLWAESIAPIDYDSYQ